MAIFATFFFIACGGGEKSVTTADSSLKEIEAEMKGMKSYMMKAITTTNEDGAKMKMSMTIWHDVANDKTATEMEMEMTAAGFSQTSKTLNIEDGEWIYIINLKDKTGVKMRNNDDDDGMFDYEIQEDEATLRQMIEADGGRIIGTETFLARNCIVVEAVDEDYDYGTITTKMWLYKGMPLKMVSDNMNMEVTHLEENVRIPAERFKVPAGVTIK
jgi:outer membrane lipoprotein-sorting protein